MASTRDRPHIQVPNDPWRSKEPYRPHPGGGSSKEPGAPAIGRPAHGRALEFALETALRTAQLRRAATTIDIRGATPGVYVEFESFPGWELALKSMEKTQAKDPRKHIEVVAVSKHVEGTGDQATTTQHAAIFVPDDEVDHYLKQLEKYVLTTPKATKSERRYEKVYDRVAGLRLAALRALWTDDDSVFPTNDEEPIWWEVWLRRTDGYELQRFCELAAQAEIHVAERRLQFVDRIVILARAAPRSLAAALDVLGDIAELQRPKEAASFFLRERPKEQAEWALDLVGRTQLCGPDAPAVCILDTGVNAGHPLLEGVLASEDCHAYDQSWGTHDHHGHGTEMAGLATYGDLAPVLESSGVVTIAHRLESVKLLPPAGSNEPKLYGDITADAASRLEIQAPHRRRVFSMAITTDDSRDRGQPTSWSSAIDALAAGRAFYASDKGLEYIDDGTSSHRRLFVVSAGNIDQGSLERDHLSRSDNEPVCDPAQAWNALTVGAYTSKAIISDPTFDGWDPVAIPGELSPWSRTSVVFQNTWPLKPDIVLEGGNMVVDAANNIDFADDLGLLTTFFRANEKLFVPTGMTSAATAQAAGLCASISAGYPALWPETVRALVIHSAEWTPAMMERLKAARSKASRARLARRYGFGVPSLDRALRSARSATTLVVQDAIRPFEEGSMREIHIHELPWPRDELAALGSALVRVRVTLSYFVEPNPGRRGWQTKHRYQSHGLRFEVKRATEAPDAFRKRLNKSALDEEEKRPSSDGNSDSWFLGPQARNSGSVHSDTLDGLAVEIAERGTIAVFPVTGWWKELKKRDRSEHGARYALVVSIETDAIDADVWTPIANQLGIAVEI
jgi:Subtilase family